MVSKSTIDPEVIEKIISSLET
ncbi:DUF2292 domain-containing protein, partial [Bacillus subtilis]